MESLSNTTYRFDRLRAPFFGIMEAGWITFGLLVAIRVYDAPEGLKATISAAGFFGLLLNTITLAIASRIQWPSSKVIFFYLIVSGGLLLTAALWPNIWAFSFFFILAHIVHSQQSPLGTQIYSENYSPSERGSKVATTFMLIASGGMVASYLGGKVLDKNINHYPYYFILMAAASVVAGILIKQIPTSPLSIKDTGHPWKSISLLWEDKLFGWLLGCWMFMGLGNLMTIPLRVEYMANPIYEINASNGQIALITFIVPSLMRILSAKVWGMLFDRLNFITWRLCINACFVVSFIVFFNSKTIVMLGVGTSFLGIAMGGGFIAWNLWVTKIAPPEKVSAYMSMHTAFTGIRGVAAPFLGYALLAGADPQRVAWVSALMVIVSSAMFAFVRKSTRFDI